MLHLYLRTKNEHNAALRLDATVKVVEKCSFQTNGLIFGLRSKLIIVMIVLTVAAQSSMHPRTDLQILTASPAGVQQIRIPSVQSSRTGWSKNAVFRQTD